MAKSAKSKNKKSHGRVAGLLNKLGQSRKATVALTLVAILAFSGVGYYFVNKSSAATAGSLCGGSFNLVENQSIYKRGSSVEIGRLNLLKNGNNFCAVLISKNGADGIRKPMKVQLGTPYRDGCSTSSDSGVSGQGGAADIRSARVDSGNYSEYAGPIKRLYERGECVYTLASMSFQGTSYWAWVQSPR